MNKIGNFVFSLFLFSLASPCLCSIWVRARGCLCSFGRRLQVHCVSATTMIRNGIIPYQCQYQHRKNINDH